MAKPQDTPSQNPKGNAETLTAAETAFLESIPDESLRRDANDDVISPDAYFHLSEGVQHFKRSDLGGAETEFIKAIDLHPPLAPLYNVFGLLKIARRALEALKQSVYQALTTDPQFMDEFVREGIEHLANERFTEAEASFNQAIAMNPNNTDARFRLGFTMVSQRKHQDAIAIFEDLILRDPQNINAFFMLGMAYSEIREYYPCISNLQHALRLQPAFVEARLTLADAYHHQGKYLISMRELAELESFIPDEDTTYLHRGMILLEMEQFEEAIPYFEKVIELKPEVTEAYELLVGLHENLGNFQRALELAYQAQQYPNPSPDILAAAGRIEQKLHKLEHQFDEPPEEEEQGPGHNAYTLSPEAEKALEAQSEQASEPDSEESTGDAPDDGD